MHLIDSVLTPSPATFVVEVDGEAIVLDETTGTLHLLNATGSMIWQCIDGESTLGEICADLADILGAPYDDVADGAETLARQLLDEGLATSPESAPAFVEPELERPSNGGCCAFDDDDHIHDDRITVETPNY